MPVLIVICVLLAIALTLAVIKIVLLRRGFDELTENIEDQVSGKTQIPVTLTTSDPHARHTAEILNRELKNLDRERNEYLDGNRKVAEAVTGISHDIRTPLTAINSYLDLMADEKDEALKAQYLERIKSRTLSLSDLADELFKYSTSTDPERYPVQTENISSEPIDICRVLEECMLSFYAGFKKRGIEPDIEIPDEPVFVLCDKKSANRIFENIIGNAIKYANNDLKVKLDPKGQVIFSNPAPDLTPVSAAKLFDRYFTVNEGHASTGLGFSIAKELITRNNGTIEADLKDGILMITVSFNLKEAEEQN
ncbi:MAG: HAMP domain-containing histidine kinase [Clostridiales bacterium]|nr:HAMP domain-containing histidine kinase [Clostridiales bacterium]MBR3700313.1 HAMP domain-containing histidine kinase [Clostridiales bacterium]